MKKNVGNIDKVIRIVIAVIAGYFAKTGVFEAVWMSYALYAVSGIMILTAVIGTCPIYSVIGLKTKK